LTGAVLAITATAKWRRLKHSLGARLTLLFLLLALAMTLAFAAGMQAAFRSGWQDYARPLIADYIDSLAAEVGTPPSAARAQAITQRLPLRIRIDGPVVNWSSHPDAAREARDARHDPPHHDTGRANSPWRPVRLLADGHRLRFGLAALPRDDAPEDRPRLIGWATLTAMLLLVAMAYARVRWLLRPLDDIKAGALRYGAGDFSAPIPTRRHDELGELSAQINGMAEGLHHMLDAKRQLLLAISHELRSPLTRARLNAELVEDSAPRDALLNDLAEMRDLIADLLESERLAAGHAALRAEPTDLNALIRELVDTRFAGRGIALMLDPAVPLVQLDPARLRLLLRNLLDNALRHSAGARAAPSVSTSVESRARRDRSVDEAGELLVLKVRDHGPGVDAAQLPLLAEAFYRPDSARQRATGGVGLGLYLCRLVAQAHGGTMQWRNAVPGLEVEVRLPLRRA
jgi:signal transduction histidine kinase